MPMFLVREISDTLVIERLPRAAAEPTRRHGFNVKSANRGVCVESLSTIERLRTIPKPNEYG